MPGPRPAGALIYAKDLERLSAFYQVTLGMTPLAADPEHHVIENADAQLIIHAIPPHIAGTFTISVPPEPREEAAIKLFFTVAILSDAEGAVQRGGGLMLGQTYNVGGMFVRNGCDVEGNIFHLRAHVR
jgi:predicted enzyme related to lactoylglutathione lyase